LRYIYSQLFSTSLNEKAGFFNPVFFSYPNDEESYNNIDEKAMVGDAFILFPIFTNETDDKPVMLPPGKWNFYPKGKILKNYDDERNINLSGELDIIHLYMRGGVIVPWQNTFDKYIKNSYYLRKEEYLNLIININEEHKAQGVIFFDNDGVNTIENKNYIRIDLNYENNNLNVDTTVKKDFNYEYNDNHLGVLELWGETNKQECNITISTKEFERLSLGPYQMIKDDENDKFYVDLSEDQLKIDDVINIIFNFD
jgi:alpha-glucosidase (family GH31 glycosyl hydrolase)